MSQILVIGYGNPLRGDDGLGWTVAVELLRQNLPEVEALPCHQLTPELASAIRTAETVIFVDCAHEGFPGEFHCVEIQPGLGRTTFTHDVTPASLLSLACELFGVCPRTYQLSICGENFETGETFSAAMTRSLPELRIRLEDLIASGLARPLVGA